MSIVTSSDCIPASRQSAATLGSVALLDHLPPLWREHPCCQRVARGVDDLVQRLTDVLGEEASHVVEAVGKQLFDRLASAIYNHSLISTGTGRVAPDTFGSAQLSSRLASFNPEAPFTLENIRNVLADPKNISWINPTHDHVRTLRDWARVALTEVLERTEGSTMSAQNLADEQLPTGCYWRSGFHRAVEEGKVLYAVNRDAEGISGIARWERKDRLAGESA